MKVKSIKAGMKRLLPVLEAWEAKKVARDFEKLIKLMDGFDDMTMAEFCQKARQGLETKNNVPSKGVNGLRQHLVEGYVNSLKQAQSQDRLFSSAIEELKTDKLVRKQELTAIATRYIGHEPTNTNKQEILREIIIGRAKDLRTKHKFKILSEW